LEFCRRDHSRSFWLWTFCWALKHVLLERVVIAEVDRMDVVAESLAVLVL
jgi:hypothetical protein